MRMYVIDAWVLGEKVNLFYKPSTQRTVDEWMKENEKRLTDKGFSGFDIYSYSEDF